MCKLNSILRSRNKLTRDFVPRFRGLESCSLSHFRSRLVASLTKLWLLFGTYMVIQNRQGMGVHVVSCEHPGQ